MSARLQRITDWDQRAEQSSWSASTLAGACRVSLRTLERHFWTAMNQTIRHWLHHERLRRGHELLLKGFTVKEVAAKLDYPHAQHFSRDFKKHFGRCPCEAV